MKAKTENKFYTNLLNYHQAVLGVKNDQMGWAKVVMGSLSIIHFALTSYQILCFGIPFFVANEPTMDSLLQNVVSLVPAMVLSLYCIMLFLMTDDCKWVNGYLTKLNILIAYGYVIHCVAMGFKALSLDAGLRYKAFIFFHDYLLQFTPTLVFSIWTIGYFSQRVATLKAYKHACEEAKQSAGVVEVKESTTKDEPKKKLTGEKASKMTG